MAVKFVSEKCPECGATLSIEEGRKEAFCTYCGAKILISNENEHVYHNIDEAQIIQAKTDRMVKLKQIELAEREDSRIKQGKSIRIISTILLFFVMVVCFTLGSKAPNSWLVGLLCPIGIIVIWSHRSKEKRINKYNLTLQGKAMVPSAIENYTNKNYEAVAIILENAGFTNVKCVPLNDLKVGLLNSPGQVESVVINGENISSGGRVFANDAAVVISYHSFAGGALSL